MRPRVIIGIVIIVWGLLLTAANLGWMDWYRANMVFRLWPLAIVLIGVVKFTSAMRRSSRLFAGLIILVGLWLTAEQTLNLRLHFWHFWPLLLVIAGVLLVSRAWESSAAGGVEGTTEGASTAFLSGIERHISAPDFRQAEFTAIMGGIKVDLTGAKTATGEAVIDVFALMGGIEITVPSDWAVVNQVTPILGGVEDNSAGTSSAQHRLILRGYAMMGGVEIKT